MNPKLCINLLLSGPVVFLLLLSPVTLSSQLKADKTSSVSNVLGRTVRLDAICDDFEDKDWHYDYQKHECYRRLWQPTERGEPELLTRVTTPDGGKRGSTGALEIRTNDNGDDPDPNQEDLKTVEFKQILGRNLTRADQPVFIVHVWMPPFDQWSKGEYYNFGFRQAPRWNNKSEYYPSIFLFYNTRHSTQAKPGPCFVFRIGTDMAEDVYGGPIKQPGWWTLAIAFDEKGFGHYYVCPKVDIPTEKNRMFDTTQFRTKNGTDNPSMSHVRYSFFSLGYPIDDKISPRFVIDDYEVWVIKRKGLE